MTRLMIALSFLATVAFVPLIDAASSSSGTGSASNGGIEGQIQSVATTNFTIGTGGHHRHRRAGGTKAIVVHYNPDTTTVTIDGAVVRQLDYQVTGKYATVF